MRSTTSSSHTLVKKNPAISMKEPKVQPETKRISSDIKKNTVAKTEMPVPKPVVTECHIKSAPLFSVSKIPKPPPRKIKSVEEMLCEFSKVQLLEKAKKNKLSEKQKEVNPVSKAKSARKEKNIKNGKSVKKLPKNLKKNIKGNTEKVISPKKAFELKIDLKDLAKKKTECITGNKVFVPNNLQSKTSDNTINFENITSLSDCTANSETITIVSLSDSPCEAEMDVKMALLEQCGWLKKKLNEGIKKTDLVLQELRSLHSVCRSRSVHSQTRSQQLASRFSDNCFSSPLTSVYEKFPSFRPKGGASQKSIRPKTSLCDKQVDKESVKSCSKSLGPCVHTGCNNSCSHGESCKKNSSVCRSRCCRSRNSCKNGMARDRSSLISTQIEEIGPMYLEAELRQCLERLAKLEVENKALKELLYNRRHTFTGSSGSTVTEEMEVESELISF